MFRGVYELNLDTKGRLSIPRPHQKVFSQGVIITIDTQQCCLLIYALPQWQKIEIQIQALPSFDPAAKRVQRLVLGHATDVSIDPNGRLLVPSPLREYAQLDKKVVLIGQGKKFELWNKANWSICCETWLKEEKEALDPRSASLLAISL